MLWWIVGGLAAAAAMISTASLDKAHEPRPKPPPPSPSPGLGRSLAVALAVFVFGSLWVVVVMVNARGSLGLTLTAIAGAALLSVGVGAWFRWNALQGHARREQLRQDTYRRQLDLWHELQDITHQYREKFRQRDAAELDRVERKAREKAEADQRMVDERERIERERREAEEQEAPVLAAAAQEYAAAQTHRHRVERVRKALVWWTAERPHAPEYVQANWEQIIAGARRARDRYNNLDDLAATHERCQELAVWALASIPDELAHFLLDDECNASTLTTILRDHHGFFVEWLLPRALEIERAWKLRPEPAPAQRSEIDQILADLPADVRQDLTPEYRAALLREDLDYDTLERFVAATRTRAEARGDTPEQIAESEKRLRLNLKAIHARHSMKRKIV